MITKTGALTNFFPFLPSTEHRKATQPEVTLGCEVVWYNVAKLVKSCVCVNYFGLMLGCLLKWTLP